MKSNAGAKILFAFRGVLGLLCVISVFSLVQVFSLMSAQSELMELRYPTVNAGMQLEVGMNQSLAGLRGYMILGEDSEKGALFKAERQKGWEEIDSAMKTFAALSKSWTVPQNRKNLVDIQKLVAEFRTAQQDVEDIAQSPRNIPSIEILLNDAAPKAAIILSNITLMINTENQLGAGADRKRLLKLLADSRGSFAMGLANIRAYLISGNESFKDDFEVRWGLNQERRRQIDLMANILNAEQRRAWQSYKDNQDGFALLPEKMFASRSSADWNLANYWLGTLAAPKAKAITTIFNKMQATQIALTAEAESQVKNSAMFLRIVLAIAAIFAVVVAIAGSKLLQDRILNPLAKVLKRADEISQGDLSGSALEAKSNDEISMLSRAINRMHINLNDIVGDVSQSTHMLNDSMTNLQAAAEKTTADVRDQRYETEQVAGTINEVGATIEEIATSAREAATAAESADKQAADGKFLVEENRDGITQLADTIEQAMLVINRLGDNTRGVDEITETISGIAEQTNLLALNAAIEAARAGEQGRGFAVVADEVRTLAARTQESTGEIRTMLERLKLDAKEAVSAMDGGFNRAKSSVEDAQSVSSALAGITESISVIRDMNAQIATASEQQGIAVEGINRSINNVDATASEAMKTAESSQREASQLKLLTDSLELSIKQFKLS